MDDSSLREMDILYEHEKGFADNFIADLDSWFSADIACCDNCYDQFLEYWPLANDRSFQSSLIDLDTFYSGSKRLQHCYSKEEYDVLKHTIHCPRCGSKLDANMWVYDLPFASEIDTFDFEINIEDVSEISRTTPFLLLNNKFASDIYDVLHNLADMVHKDKIDATLFRGRIAKHIERLHFGDFSVAPESLIQEGRYNHAGEQVLYLASDMKTCYFELNQNLCYIAECGINSPMKILDLSSPSELYGEHQEYIKALVFSALMSKKNDMSGWHKPVYVFSRFISDCAKAAGFDAIKYPSTKEMSGNFNLAIINKEIFKESISYKSLSLFDGERDFRLEI